MLNAKLVYLLLVLIVVVIVFLIWQMRTDKAPESSYSLLKKEESIEIRQYPSLVLAEVNVSGKRESAIQVGFKILANYIFGNNASQEKIAMTVPVMQQIFDEPEMNGYQSKVQDNTWTILFVMPSSYSINTLPEPANEKIKLVQTPSKKYVLIRFKGSTQQANLDEHEILLRDYLTQHHLKVIGQAIYAFYNPPWILPFFRRNEIMLELNESSR